MSRTSAPMRWRAPASRMRACSCPASPEERSPPATLVEGAMTRGLLVETRLWPSTSRSDHGSRTISDRPTPAISPTRLRYRCRASRPISLSIRASAVSSRRASPASARSRKTRSYPASTRSSAADRACDEKVRSAAISVLECLQHRVGARHFEAAGLLDVERLDDAVVDHHRVALRALAHAVAGAVHLEPDGAREVAIAVGEHLHLAVGLLILAPSVHHEGVVDREAGDGIDAFLLEGGRLLDEARQVLGRAGRRECAGQAEQHDLLALEEIVGLHVLHAVRRHLLQLDRRNLVANLDGHGLSPRCCWTTRKTVGALAPVERTIMARPGKNSPTPSAASPRRGRVRLPRSPPPAPGRASRSPTARGRAARPGHRPR